MSVSTIAPATEWRGVLVDLAWVCEWAERFPHESSEESHEWARAEIARIGRHLDSLPEQYRLEMPSEEKYLVALDIANMG